MESTSHSNAAASVVEKGGGDVSRSTSTDSNSSSSASIDTSSHSRSSSPSPSSSVSSAEEDDGRGLLQSSASNMFFFADEEEGDVANESRRAFHTAANRFNLERAHRRRRLISQRKLGECLPLPFFARRHEMKDEDAAMLLTFSNADLFYRLITVLRDKVGTEGEGGLSASEPLDTLLSSVNPYFRYLCDVQTDTTAGPPTDDMVESRFVQEGLRSWTRPPITYRHVVEESKDEQMEKGSGKGTTVSSRSRTAGFMQVSLQSWEKHLEEELRQEGETVENFRRHTAKESWVEKEKFKEQAAWKEYSREVKLQEKERQNQERKRQRPMEM